MVTTPDPVADTERAVSLFVAGRWDECRRLIAPNHAAPGYDYWWYLNLLLSRHRAAGDPGLAADAARLYVIGESHSLSAHGTEVELAGRRLRCEARWIVGCKQWHLRDGPENFYTRRLREIAASLPPSSDVLLAIGEIDSRHDDGILRFSRRHGVPVSTGIALTTGGYLDHLAGVMSPLGHRVVVQGVPCPTPVILDALEPADRQALIGLLQDFNTALRQGALARGFGFLDVHALTDDGQGASNRLFHIDHCHLVPTGTAAAFERHFVAAGGA